ncbi:MAG: hypothetical protein JW778_04015 [Candidatus Altiarchaeota archaeon]|nr:hypothetical protein [Candidatus Altiarchaeota archaeon]
MRVCVRIARRGLSGLKINVEAKKKTDGVISKRNTLKETESLRKFERSGIANTGVRPVLRYKKFWVKTDLQERILYAPKNKKTKKEKNKMTHKNKQSPKADKKEPKGISQISYRSVKQHMKQKTDLKISQKTILKVRELCEQYIEDLTNELEFLALENKQKTLLVQNTDTALQNYRYSELRKILVNVTPQLSNSLESIQHILDLIEKKQVR